MPTDLTGFDYVVLTLVGLFAFLGLVRGLTHEALSLAGWIVAAIVVRVFHEPATRFAAEHTGGEASGAIVAFLALFFGTALVARLLAGMLGGAAKRSSLGPIDRVLGLGFGAVKGIILASILFLLTQFATGLFDPARTSPDWLMKSRAAPLLSLSANAMVTWVNDLPDLPKLPAGHPEIAPDGSPRRDEGGYSDADRRALDKLLDAGEGTDI